MQADDPTLPLSPHPGPPGARRDPPAATEPVAEPEPVRAAPRRGEMLGRYLILNELGRGGMGVVYKAYDPELDRRVALKLLHPDLARGRDGVGQARLLREAQALARLSHPNVIHVYDAGTAGDRVFMAMELVQGETLEDWLAREPRPWRQTLALFRAAGQGLAAAHAAGLVHRDFKPGNVLLGADGRVRVVDFGIARPASEPAEDSGATPPPRGGVLSVLSTPLTRVGVVLGTPRYMAPEVIREGSFDHRADQFSFCVALFESLYGTPPFAGEELTDLLREVEAGRVRELPHIRIPSWVRRILLRGLQADPARRYPAMEDLLADLGRDRGAQLRRRAAAAAVLAAAVAGGLALYTVQRSEARICSGAREKLAGIWDGDRKQAIRGAFLASGRSYAADAWTGVERALDAYTGDWTAQRTEACEATRRGEQSQELLDLRMGCLDRRLREVRALTTLLASGDPAMVEKSAQASRGLTSLSECADPAALTAPVRPPAGEAARRNVDRLTTRMADAKSLWALGRYQEALAISSQAVGEAARLGYPPLEAELLRERARAEDSQGETATAEATLYAALAAAQKGRHDALAASLWTDLVWSTGYRQRRFEEARRWARLAESSIARLGGSTENPELDADLKSNLGAVLDLQGDHDGGLALLLQALAIYEKALGPEHPNVGRTLNRIGGVYYQTGRHAEALASYQRALELSRRTLGPRHPTVAIRLGNLSLALEGLGRYEEALRAQTQALAIEEAALGPDHPRVAVTHGNLAALLLVLGRHEEALRHARQGLAIDSKNPSADPADLGVSYLAVSDALYRLGRYQEALGNSRRARDLLLGALGANHSWTAGAEDSVGRILLAQGRPDEAVAPLRRAVAGFKAAGAETPDRAGALFALARALRAAGGGGAEAVALAREARAMMFRAAPQRKEDLDEIDAWLAGRS